MGLLIVAACTAIVAAAVTSPAEQIEVVLDPEASEVTFELSATLHTVHGTAELERGEFVFDTETGDASGEAVVSASSADTDNTKRDEKMHDEVLLSREHPVISIRAERLEGDLSLDGDSEVTLVGTMTLLGSAHPVRIPMTVSVEDGSADVVARWTVPYVDWGLDDPSAFLLRVGKEVSVEVRATASVSRVGPSP